MKDNPKSENKERTAMKGGAGDHKGSPGWRLMPEGSF